MSAPKPTYYFLFTHKYPFGNMEVFVEQELEQLAERFDHIVVVPLSSDGTDSCRELPKNAEVDTQFIDATYRVNKHYLLTHGLLVFRVLALEVLKTRNAQIFRDIKILVETVLLMLEHGDQFAAKHLTSPSVAANAIFHASWMYENTLMLALLKSRGKIPQFQFRVHGYDLYEERRKGNYMPFRHFIVKHAARIITISNLGRNYLKQRGIAENKLRTCYLGVNDHGVGPYDAEAVFTIVSVSNLIPLKRIHRILEALAQLDFPVRFVQFGKGPLLEDLQQQAQTLPKHIECRFEGEIKNAELMAWYQANSVNCHILVSETEGLPMAPVEAMSFGIPAIVTNVGGVGELMNDQNGILLEADFSNEVLVAAIKRLRTELDNSKFRAGVRQSFLQNWEATANYKRFADVLLEGRA